MCKWRGPGATSHICYLLESQMTQLEWVIYHKLPPEAPCVFPVQQVFRGTLLKVQTHSYGNYSGSFTIMLLLQVYHKVVWGYYQRGVRLCLLQNSILFYILSYTYGVKINTDCYICIWPHFSKMFAIFYWYIMICALVTEVGGSQDTYTHDSYQYIKDVLY